MFCKKCGSQNYDDAKFCTTCAAPLGDAPAYGEASAPYGAPAPKPSNNPTKLIVGIVAAVAVIVVGLWAIFANTGINGTINKIERGLKKCDLELLVESIAPKSAINDMIDEEFDGDKGEYKDQLKEWEEEAKEVMDDEDIKVVSLKKEGKIKKLSKSDLEELGYERKGDFLEDIEEEFDIDNVKDVKKCKVKLTVKVDGDKETAKGYAYFYKVGSKWYFLIEGSPILYDISSEFSSILY